MAYSKRGGHYVVLDHGNGLKTGYYHMNKKPNVKNGQYIEQRYIIGMVGTLGSRSTGPHLHFTVSQNGRSINPKILLPKEGYDVLDKKRDKARRNIVKIDNSNINNAIKKYL